VLPENDYYEYYGPDYKLDVPAGNMPNHNTPEYLDRIRERVFEILRRLPGAPSAEALKQVAPNIVPDEDDAMDRDLDTELAKDTKIPRKLWDKQRHPANSFDDMEEDL